MLDMENDSSGQASTWVNSMHHQAVKEVAPGFVACAHSSDGIIEAIERVPGSGIFQIGVQWHPEELVPEHAVMVRLFRRFIESSCP